MAADLSELAQRESRKDAKVNVNLIIQLPHDVPQEVREQILKAVSHELFGRHGLPYAASLHRPDPGGDERNFHGHICGSWRPMTRAAPYGWDIAEDYRSDLDGPAYWRHARRRVAEIMTAALEREGTVRHYTHLSNAERGLAHKPQKKLDKRKTRASREGEFVADNEANRRLIEANVALDKRLKEKRQTQRRRSLNRKIAALARVELASLRSLDLGPVSSYDTVASSGPKVAFVPPFQKSAATSLHPVREGRNSAAPAAALSAVEAPPSDVNIRLRGVTPTTWNDQVAKVEPVTRASITPGLSTVSHGTQNAAWTTLLHPVAVPEKGAANLRAVAKPTQTEGLGLLAPIRRRLVNPEAEFALKPVENNLRKPPQLRPVDAKPRLQILGLKPIAKIPNPWPRIMKVTGSITSSISTLRPVAGAPAALNISLSAILRPVDPPFSLHLTQTNLRPVSPVSHHPEIRPVDPPRRTTRPNIRPVPSPAREWRLSERIARVERTAIEPLSQLRRVDRAVASGLDPRLVQAIQAFAERLAAIARRRDAIRDQVRPENIDTSASENRAAETEPGAALASNLQAFADAMRRKPTGLTLSEDGIMLPVSALASSWGVSREALASDAAKRLLMPLYVEQELRFERLEIELKFAGIGERELADPERKFAKRLSADAAKTLEIYSRSQLLHDALHRVYREISLGENVRSRTREMTARGIDWGAFAAHAEDRRRSLRLAQQQSISRQNGLE